MNLEAAIHRKPRQFLDVANLTPPSLAQRTRRIVSRKDAKEEKRWRYLSANPKDQ
jgi:hypothetical protein